MIQDLVSHCKVSVLAWGLAEATREFWTKEAYDLTLHVCMSGGGRVMGLDPLVAPIPLACSCPAVL